MELKSINGLEKVDLQVVSVKDRNGHPTLILMTENGEYIRGQVSLSLEYSVDECPTVTVKFIMPSLWGRGF